MSRRDEISEARLRDAFQASEDPAPGPATACPSPADLWSALRGEVGEAARHDIVDHLAACAPCAEAWRLAMAVSAEALAVSPGALPEAGGAPPRAVSAFRWRPALVPLAAAAALVIAVGALWLGKPDSDTPPGFRGEGAPAIRSLVSEGESLPRQDFHLRWSPGPEGSRYDLRVTTEALRVVATAQGLTEPSYRVPEAALASLPSGSRLLWRVDVVLADGGRESSLTFVTLLR